MSELIEAGDSSIELGDSVSLARGVLSRKQGRQGDDLFLHSAQNGSKALALHSLFGHFRIVLHEWECLLRIGDPREVLVAANVNHGPV